GSDALPVTPDSSQLDSDPVIPIAALITQTVSWTGTRRNDDVNVPIVVQISKGCASSRPVLVEDFTGGWRDIDKLVPDVPQEQGFLSIAQVGLCELDVVHHMAVGKEQILPAVIVIIKDSHPPTRKQPGDLSETGSQCGIAEATIAFVAKI